MGAVNDTELKPCPYCGGKGEIKSFVNEPVVGVTLWSATCTRCGAQMRFTTDNGVDGIKMIRKSWDWECYRIERQKLRGDKK